jgi:hypothetical protein
LNKKLKTAEIGLAKAQAAYVDVTASISPELIQEWGIAEAKAMKERGKALKIFEVQQDKRLLSTTTNGHILMSLFQLQHKQMSACL